MANLMIEATVVDGKVRLELVNAPDPLPVIIHIGVENDGVVTAECTTEVTSSFRSAAGVARWLRRVVEGHNLLLKE